MLLPAAAAGLVVVVAVAALSRVLVSDPTILVLLPIRQFKISNSK